MGAARCLLFKQFVSLKSNIKLRGTLEACQCNHLVFSRSYGKRTASNSKLYASICLLGSSNSIVAPFLDRWVEEGNKLHESELQLVIRLLRSRKRHSQALEVSEWMSAKMPGHFLSGDHALRLDLIGKVHGVRAAEGYFNKIEEKCEKIYGALFSCYIRDGLVNESLSHFQKMKDMGFTNRPLAYNDLMGLYLNTGQLEKIPTVLSEMKRNGVSPDNISYRICLNAYGSRSDFENMEKLLSEMECQPYISMDWSTYTTMASFYGKADLHDKVLHYLRKAESRVVLRDIRGYYHLITLYASLRNKPEMMRLWRMLQASCHGKLVNIAYIAMMGSLVKIGEFEEAEKVFAEWESSGNLYDFRVPNVLLIGYTRTGFTEKAEKMLLSVTAKGKAPIPNSWSIIAAGHVREGKMERAFECMKKALALVAQYPGWVPKPDLVSQILEWLGDEGEVGEVEEFVGSLKKVVPVDRDMYYALIRANMRHGNEVGGILENMKADNIDEDEDMKILLAQDGVSRAKSYLE